MTVVAPIADRILRLAEAVQREIDALYRSSEPLAPTSPLNQAGLSDGLVIVAEYLHHSELGLAFEHLAYMLVEPGLPLTRSQFEELAAIGGSLELRPELWQRVGVRG